MLKTHPTMLFIKYAIPSVLGLLAISSASIVDGYFIGNHVGALGLAAINISYPIFNFLFGFALMFAVGSSVMVGKLMGENNLHQAQSIFSQTLLYIILLASTLCTLLYLNVHSLFIWMNLDSSLKILTEEYLSTILLFLPFSMTGIVLSYLVRVDENPNLSFLALLGSAVVNIILDYVFIVKFGWGMAGAAYATGLSQIGIILILIPHFFLKTATLKIIKPTGSFRIIFHACRNGISEFIDESSVGITVLIFNAIILKTFGAMGVASYTIIGYMILISIMFSFAIADALQPLISKNYGAASFDRIKRFLKLGFSVILIVEGLFALFVVLFPEHIIHLFLKQNNQQSIQITLEFITYAWPAFILSGINILITSYLTSLQKPLYSATIAILRSLILPVLFITLLPYIFGNVGIFMALSVAECLTLFVALYLYGKAHPSKLA